MPEAKAAMNTAGLVAVVVVEEPPHPPTQQELEDLGRPVDASDVGPVAFLPK